MVTHSGSLRSSEPLARASRSGNIHASSESVAHSKGKDPVLDDRESRREREGRHSQSRDHSRHHSHRRRSEIGSRETHSHSSTRIHRDEAGASSVSRNHSSRHGYGSGSRDNVQTHYTEDSGRRRTESSVSGHRDRHSSLSDRLGLSDRSTTSRSGTIRQPAEPSSRPPLSRSKTTSAREPRQHESPPVSYNASKVARVTSSGDRVRSNDASSSSSRKFERPSSRQSARASPSSSTTKVDRPAPQASSSSKIPQNSSTRHIDPKSIVGSLFGTGATKPKESKPKDTPSKEVRPKEPPRRDSRSKETKPKEPKPEKKYDCMICCDPFPRHKVHIQKPCNHIMCNSCLRNMFTNSLQDPTQMPPACCSKDNPIDPHHAGSLFDLAFKRKWNRKYVEFTTQNRIYCPRKGCGKFIHPSNIYVDHSGGANTGRKFGICSRCDTKVCKTCAQKWHTSKECPKDETLKEFQRMADKEGWRKCYNCRATVELAVGCNHMTCRCGAQFCMVCGLKWHTCECSMFTDDMIEQDRLEHERNPRAGLDRLWEEARHQDDEEDEELARRLARHLWDEDLDDWGGGRDQFRDGPPPPRPVPAPNHDPAANEARRGRPRDDDLYRRGIDILTGAFTEGNNAAAEQLVQEIRVHVRQPRVYDVPLPNTHPSPNRRHLSPRPAPPRPPVRRGSIYPGRGVPADTYARGRGLGQGQGMGDVPTVMDFLDPEQDAAEVEGREARRRASMLAGIHRGQQGGGRVEEWRRHVAVA